MRANLLWESKEQLLNFLVELSSTEKPIFSVSSGLIVAWSSLCVLLPSRQMPQSALLVLLGPFGLQETVYASSDPGRHE